MENRICALCGDEFTPTHPRQKVCTKQHYRPCCICGTPIPIKRPSDPKYVCSLQCEMENRRRHNVEKYGVDHPMQLESVRKKHREAMKELYGVESPLQSEEIKQRAIKSNRERYGADSVFSNAVVREKIKNTMLERYGVAYSFQSEALQQKSKDTLMRKYGVTAAARIPGIRDKIKATCIDRYGARNPMMCKAIALRAKESRIRKNGKFWTPEMRKKSESTFMKHYGVNNPSKSQIVIDKIADSLKSRYGVNHAVCLPEFSDKMKVTSVLRYGSESFLTSDFYARVLNTPRISNTNRHFAKMLDDIGISYEFEHSVGLKSYDLYIPDQNLLIEIDPTYTHSIIPNHMRGWLDKRYHIEKTIAAEQNGYKCIHIFDWDDKNLICDMLSRKTIIDASQCDIKEIPENICKSFEIENHPNGAGHKYTVCYGLYYNNDLVATASFGNPMYCRAFQYELKRICIKRCYYIENSVYTFISSFKEEYNPKSVVVYLDKAKFSGDDFEDIGFKHLADTPPSCTWSKRKKRMSHKSLIAKGYRKSDFSKLIQENWRPVYDCGYGIYVFHQT